MPKNANLPPDYPLFLSLLMQPPRPLVLHQFILEAVFLRHVRDEILQHINTWHNKPLYFIQYHTDKD